MIKTSDLIETLRARAVAVNRDWNPDNCERGSSGYIPAPTAGDPIDLASEAAVSAYTTADGAIMIGTNGGDDEAEEDTAYGVAELAALADLRDALNSDLFGAYYRTQDEKNDPSIKRLNDQIDYIDGLIDRHIIKAIADYEGLQIVWHTDLPNAELLADTPYIRSYADEGIRDKDGNIIVAVYPGNPNAGEYCTWGQTRELDDGTTALDCYEPDMNDIADFLAVALL